MSKQIKAMKLALEALELVTWTNNPPVNKAIVAIRQALGQPAPAPVRIYSQDWFRTLESEQPAQAREPVATWVSVKDSLPPVGEVVLTYSVDYPEDGFDCERYLGGDEWSVKFSVSHWMPLPIVPIESDDNVTKGGEW